MIEVKKKSQPINSNSKKVQETRVSKEKIKVDLLPSKIKININILICPICLNFAFQPVECSNCSHLFCAQDYVNGKRMRNKCPTCNHQPWSIKPTIHLMYKFLIEQQAKFHCKICGDDNLYKVKEFKSHLAKKHNKKIEDYHLKLYKYWIKDNNIKIILNFIQNLQINYYLYQLKSKIIILDEKFGQFQLNLNEDKCHYQKKDGKTGISLLYKQEMKQNGEIVFDKVYHAWSFDNNSTEEQIEQFYLQSHQKVIQKSYALYLKNNNQNSVNIDLPNQKGKYKITFNNLSQINNSTQNIIKIRRKDIIFCSTIK